VDASIYDLDSTCSVGSQCSAANQEGSKFVFRKNDTEVVQFIDIFSQYSDYNNEKAAYYLEFLAEYELYYGSAPNFFDYLFSIVTLGAY